MGRVIGIDLGTTNSCVAIVEDGQPVVLTNQEGSRTTPSVVAFTKENTNLVGQIAKRQAVTNPENTIYSAKRFIGKNFSEVKDERHRMPYKVVQKGDGCAFKIKDEVYTPEQISSIILQKLKTAAEDYLHDKVTEAVITVPAYFNDSQRQATKDAGKIAGLEVKRIINEPTAAALAYGYGVDKKDDKNNKEIKKVIVFDFGGGTFDVSIIEIDSSLVEVKATNGDTHLGGDDFDKVILDWLFAEFKKSNGIDLSTDKMALQRLKEATEKAKIELSSAVETEINLPFITADASGPKHLNMKLTRSKFENLSENLIQRSIDCCKRALEDSGFKVSEIDEVLLVGGSTRIPSIQEAIKKFFKKEPNKSINPDEVVALGAALQGGILSSDVKNILLLDVTPLSLGIETLGGVCTRLIDRNTTIPTKKSQVFSTSTDNQPSVNVHILQGERNMAADNKSLGQFELSGIAPAPRGVPQIEVNFDIDANGILNVSAKDLQSGKEQSIRITSRSNLSQEDIKKMIDDAETHAEADRKQREVVELRNRLDHNIYKTEKLIKDNSDKISKDLKSQIETEIASAKNLTSSSSNDKEKLSSADDSLTKLSQKVSEEMYKSTSKEEDSKKQASSSEEKKDVKDVKKENEDVIDADFKDIEIDEKDVN